MAMAGKKKNSKTGTEVKKRQHTADPYEYILNLLMTKKLMPGDRINDMNLAKEIGCSRTPVREALKKLESCGLIDILPNRYMQVTVYTKEMINEVGTMRLYLELMAGKLALIYGSRLDFHRLQEIAQKCCDALNEGDNIRRLDYDCEFHMELTRITGHKLLMKYQQEMYLRFKFIFLHNEHLIEDEVKHTNQHLEIVSALEKGDWENLQTIIKDHLYSFYKKYSDIPLDLFN